MDAVLVGVVGVVVLALVLVVGVVLMAGVDGGCGCCCCCCCCWRLGSCGCVSAVTVGSDDMAKISVSFNQLWKIVIIFSASEMFVNERKNETSGDESDGEGAVMM